MSLSLRHRNLIVETFVMYLDVEILDVKEK
jgi:hypothetical protein